MAHLNVEIPDQLKRDVDVAAAQDRENIKDWAAAALQYYLDQRKKSAGDKARLSSGPEAEVVEGLASPGKTSASKPSPGRVKRAPKKH